MHRHGIGRLQLAQLGKIVVYLPVIIHNRHGFHVWVDGQNRTDISVKYAGTCGTAVAFLPHYIIVIPDLHHPIALPEQKFSELALFFCGSRGIQRRLQGLIQRAGAHAALPGGRKHLDLICRNAHFLRQPLGAQAGNGLAQLLFRPAGQEEKVTFHIPKLGHNTLVGPVGVHNDKTLLGLSENLCEPNRRQHLAAQTISKGETWTYRRQLIRVTHQNQPLIARYGLQ